MFVPSQRDRARRAHPPTTCREGAYYGNLFAEDRWGYSAIGLAFFTSFVRERFGDVTLCNKTNSCTIPISPVGYIPPAPTGGCNVCDGVDTNGAAKRCYKGTGPSCSLPPSYFDEVLTVYVISLPTL